MSKTCLYIKQMPFCDELNTSVSHQLVLLWGLSIPCRFGFECLAWEKHAEVSVKIWLGCRKIESAPCLEELARFLGKFVTDFEKCDTDFGQNCHRLWENLPPTLGKSATDCGNICHRLWKNLPPTLGSSVF